MGHDFPPSPNRGPECRAEYRKIPENTKLTKQDIDRESGDAILFARSPSSFTARESSAALATQYPSFYHRARAQASEAKSLFSSCCLQSLPRGHKRASNGPSPRKKWNRRDEPRRRGPRSPKPARGPTELVQRKMGIPEEPSAKRNPQRLDGKPQVSYLLFKVFKNKDALREGET